jgi:hypothetical protein
MVTDLVPRTTVHDRADKRAILVALCLGALIINVDSASAWDRQDSVEDL